MHAQKAGTGVVPVRTRFVGLRVRRESGRGRELKLASFVGRSPRFDSSGFSTEKGGKTR